MDSDIIIAILKTSGAFVSGLLGLTALLTNFRTVEGRLTLTGKLVLVGILVSATVSTITSALESFSNFESNKEQLARNEDILRQISRAVQPISELGLTYFITLPKENPVIDQYVKRLQSAVEERYDDLVSHRSHSKYKGLRASTLGSGGELLTVSVQPDSDLWPGRPEEEPLNTLIKTSVPSLSFVKDPLPLSDYPLTFGLADLSAMSMIVPKDGSYSLLWHPKEEKLQIMNKVNYDKEFWHSSGKITSLTDIPGSQIAINFHYSDPTKMMDLPGRINVDANRNKFEIASNIALEAVSLKLGSGRSLKLSSDQFEKSIPTRFGGPVFTVTFPSSESEMSEFLSFSEKR